MWHCGYVRKLGVRLAIHTEVDRNELTMSGLPFTDLRKENRQMKPRQYTRKSSNLNSGHVLCTVVPLSCISEIFHSGHTYDGFLLMGWTKGALCLELEDPDPGLSSASFPPSLLGK